MIGFRAIRYACARKGLHQAARHQFKRNVVHPAVRPMSTYNHAVHGAAMVNQQLQNFTDTKLERLKNLDFFLLDNSIRESTVGQFRGHTLENKIAILEEVKKTGAKNIIVTAFAHFGRVDDIFAQHLVDTNEDKQILWSFSEVTEGILDDGTYDDDTVPIALQKNAQVWILQLSLRDGFSIAIL